MVMLPLVVMIMVFPVAIVILFDHGFAASPRGGSQQSIRVRPTPREGGDEKQKQKTGSSLSHVGCRLCYYLAKGNWKHLE